MTADNCQTCGHAATSHSFGYGDCGIIIAPGVRATCPCTAFTPVAALDAEPEDYPWASEILSRKIAEKFDRPVAAREAAPDDTALICCPACGNQRWEWLVPPNPTGEWNLECECGHTFTWVAEMHPAPAREAAQAEVTLTADEKAQIDGACIIDWKRGWSGIHPDRHAINAIVESILADRLAGRGQE